MNIVIATSGSRGDVQPMVALALGLKKKGHEVLLVGPPERAAWAEALGCPYQGLGRDVTAFLDTIDNPISIPCAIRFVNYVRNEVRTQFKQMPRILHDADLVIGASLMFGLSSVAEALNLPYRYVVFTPQLFPSSAHPFPAFKTQTLPGWCNRLTWRAADFADRLNLTALVNRHRKALKLRPVGNLWTHVLGEHPIAACDPQIARIPPDVVPRPVQTGYMHLGIPDPGYPELEAFLAAGPPPIYAGFGSMPPRDQARHVPMLIRAARQLKKRIIISKFWKDAVASSDSSDVFFIKSYPHEYLFPRTSVILHHGGAGTTATATRAGKPQVIVPHILDQYYHGHCIFRSGLGAKPVWRSGISLKTITRALEVCFSTPHIRHAAEAAARKIDPERSMETTIQRIEQAAKKS